jgi:hypothetical protein
MNGTTHARIFLLTNIEEKDTFDKGVACEAAKESQQIQHNGLKVDTRIFTFGIGDKVDSTLLAKVA